MIDRINFSNSIENIDENNIMSFFDPLMALYGILYNANNMVDSVSANPNPSEVSFDITFKADDNKITDEIAYQCDHRKLNIYGTNTTILCNKESNNKLSLKFLSEV